MKKYKGQDLEMYLNQEIEDKKTKQRLKQRHAIPLEMKCRMFREITKAVWMLNDENICHGDLGGNTIFVNPRAMEIFQSVRFVTYSSH